MPEELLSLDLEKSIKQLESWALELQKNRKGIELQDFDDAVHRVWLVADTLKRIAAEKKQRVENYCV